MKTSFTPTLFLIVLLAACATKHRPSPPKTPEKEEENHPQPQQDKPETTAPSQAKGANNKTKSELIKSEFGSTLSFVAPLDATLGQAVSGSSIFEDHDKTLLPARCRDGVVSTQTLYGNLAMPHAVLTDLPGSTYNGSTLDTKALLTLFPNQIPKEVTDYVTSSDASTPGRFASSHILHLKTHSFVLKDVKILSQELCGDRFVQSLTPTAFLFFTLKFDIADEATRTEFAAFSFTGGADSLFSHPRKTEIVEFLKAKNIPLHLVVMQGRNQLDDTLATLVKDERCGAYELAACEKTYRRLKEYQQLAFKAQFKNPPASLADMGHWGIYEFKTADYDVHE